MASDEFERAVIAHDYAVAHSGQTIWLGSEPTFTLRQSTGAEWLGAAAGAEKEALARELLTCLAESRTRAVVMRNVGRLYPGEDTPRFCYGVLRKRDGSALWNGPPDPLVASQNAGARSATSEQARGLRDALAQRLRDRGYDVHVLDAPGPLGSRVVFSHPAAAVTTASDESSTKPPLARFDDPAFARSSHHAVDPSRKAVRDELAAVGMFLVNVGVEANAREDVDLGSVRVEFPSCRSASMFCDLLTDVGEAARALALPSLILGGFGPPADAGLEWTTVTPDPGVVEVNMAPCLDAHHFLKEQRAIYAAAERTGLSGYRLYYNGETTDSGGGGHLTFGGPTPDASPFFVSPHLLPRMIAYFVRHPSLSYLFASASVGSSSQSPRVDESAPELLDELSLALHTLTQRESSTPEVIWQTLAPLLADRFGNSHRAEINVEKLCNPYLEGRGNLGVVELRAFRMPRTPERATSVAVLLRSLLAWLGSAPTSVELKEWGSELHDRFALPFYLEQDFEDVLKDLAATTLSLREPIADALRSMAREDIAQVDLVGARVRIRHALEFWPLVGDVSAQEGTSRLLDSSTGRIEVTLRADSAAMAEAFVVSVDNARVPMRVETNQDGITLVSGIRHRRFVPAPGLHPLLGARDPLRIRITHPEHPGVEVAFHGWRPNGESYPGLPQDLAEAEARRTERVTTAPLPPHTASDELRDPPPAALTPYCLDTRYL